MSERARHWVCCARWWMCAQLSCLLFCGGDAAPWLHSQTRGRLSVRTLSPKGECSHARPPRFAVQPGGSRAHALTTCRENTLTYGTLSLESLESHTTKLHWHSVTSDVQLRTAHASQIILSDCLRVWPRSILKNELHDLGSWGQLRWLSVP